MQFVNFRTIRANTRVAEEAKIFESETVKAQA